MNAFAWWIPVAVWLGAAAVLLIVAITVRVREQAGIDKRAAANTDTAVHDWKTRRLLRRINIGPGGKVI